MPKVCEICQKGPVFGHSISHSHKASPKKWKPNLQHVKAQTSQGVRQIWVCTRCLRTGKVAKALRRPANPFRPKSLPPGPRSAV